MSESDDATMQLARLVPVRCAKCKARHGRGTLLGELGLWPDGRWSWQRAVRQGSAGEARGIAVSGEPVFGGAQVRCRRCGCQTRFRVARLAEKVGASDSLHM